MSRGRHGAGTTRTQSRSVDRGSLIRESRESKIKTIEEADEMFGYIKAEFENAIEKYREKCDGFGVGWIYEMDQQITVNGKNRSADLDDSEIREDVIACPADGKITLVHRFESEVFIPIPHTPFKIYTVKERTHEVGSPTTGARTITTYSNDKVVFDGRVDKNGMKEVVIADEFRGERLRVEFYSDIKQEDINAMLNTYNQDIADLSNWLSEYWETQREEWRSFLGEGYTTSDSYGQFFKGLLSVIVDAFEELLNLFLFLANPARDVVELGKYFANNPEEIQQLLETGGDTVREMFAFLRDEVRCFLALEVVFSYFRLFTPKQIDAVSSTIGAGFVLELILCFVVPGAILKKLNWVRDGGAVISALTEDGEK